MPCVMASYQDLHHFIWQKWQIWQIWQKRKDAGFEIISLVDVSKVNGPYWHQELRPGHLWNLNGI